MIRSMWAAASGMQAQSMNIDVIANNIANIIILISITIPISMVPQARREGGVTLGAGSGAAAELRAGVAAAAPVTRRVPRRHAGRASR